MYVKNRFQLLRSLSLAIASLFLLAGAASAAAPGPGPQVGTNLGYLSEGDGEWPFVNVFKNATHWHRSGTCGWDCGTLSLDADGWVTSLDPGEFAHTFLFDGAAGRMPHDDIVDTYAVFYDGVGVLDYDGSASWVSSRSPGHDIVRVDPSSNEPFAITIVLTAATWDSDEIVDPDDYVRNIRVIAPGGVCSNDPFQSFKTAVDCTGAATCDLFQSNGNYATQLFHPDFLNKVRNFDVLRLMDWSDTIVGGFESYSEYPKESSAHWDQVPVTIMGRLANRLGADIWVNMSHFADQSFIDGFAADLAAEIDPARKVYVEYSNELWNPEFPAYLEVAVRGCNLYSDLTTGCLNGGTILCQNHENVAIPACDTARMRYTSEHSLYIWDRFALAFNNEQLGSADSRLVRVLAS